MNPRILFYFLSVFLLLFYGCGTSKNAVQKSPEFKANKIVFEVEKDSVITYSNRHDIIDKQSLSDIVYVGSNRRLKLFVYNHIDTAKLRQRNLEKEEKYRLVNTRRQIKEDSINNLRKEKAIAAGETLYKHKTIRKKKFRVGWKNRILHDFIHEPILVDTSDNPGYVSSESYYYWDDQLDSLRYFKRSDTTTIEGRKKQLEIYLKKKGFYNASVSDTIMINKKNRATVQYIVKPESPFTIRSYRLDSTSMNRTMLKTYSKLIDKYDSLIFCGWPIDEFLLDKERDRYTAYSRDESAMFGFNKQYVNFLIDTTVGNQQADIIMYVKPRQIKVNNIVSGRDTSITIKHHVYRVDSVRFFLHNTNENSFDDFECFKRRCDSLFNIGLLDSLDENYRLSSGDYPLLDTVWIPHKGLFIYNQKPFINPHLVDRSNFLEVDGSKDSLNPKVRFCKEGYVERSYRSMQNLGVFSRVGIKVAIDPDRPTDKWTNIRYDLRPLPKQSLLIRPQFTNTNGILGFEGGISYINRNVARKAQNLKIKVSGGVESQPLIVGLNNGIVAQSQGIINTFEFEFDASYTRPKLPFQRYKSRRLSKRDYPKTTFDFIGNFQRRPEFKRTVLHLGMTVSKKIGKTQEIRASGIIDLVKLTKEDFFEESLLLINDPLLLSAYTNHQNIYMDIEYVWNSLKSNTRKSKHIHDVRMHVIPSGIYLVPRIHNNWLGKYDFVQINGENQRLFDGTPFSQFLKGEVQYVASIHAGRKHKIVYRAIVGMANPLTFGISEDESPNLDGLPYEHSFFAGGANDIRAFAARTMAPGSFKKYADPNATNTQIGESKIELNLEWRFKLSSLIENAVFIDAGNIWNIDFKEGDPNDPTLLKPSSWREVAIGLGYGIRFDLSFLIFRIDLASAIHNPYLPEGERWLWDSKDTYKSDLYFTWDPENEVFSDYLLPHPIRVNFGIGYPF